MTLAGWVARRRDHGGVTFIDLRDASGIVQVVFRARARTARARAARRVLRAGHRPGPRAGRPGNENPELPTGEIEVAADELEVLGEADPLPFPIDGRGRAERGGPAALPLPGHAARRDRPRRCASAPRPPTWSPTCCAATGSSYVETPT